MNEIQYEKAYERIREKLISQSIKPGERLIERALAEELEVNRGDIRQAFPRLLTEGLVIRGERGGIFAREYTTEHLQELAETRLALETAAAALAVERANKKDFSRLGKILDHMDLMAENGYELGFNETDLRFHNHLVKATHNERFYQLYRIANVPLTFLNNLKTVRTENTSEAEESIKIMKRDAKAHREILNALEKRDKEKLIRLLAEGMSISTKSKL